VVAVVAAAGVVEKRVGVADRDVVGDNVVAVVDGEADPPTLSVPNAADVLNVPVVAAAPAVSKRRDGKDTASSPAASPSRPYPLPPSSRVDASPCPPPSPYRCSLRCCCCCCCCSSSLQSSITVKRLDCGLDSEPYSYGPLLLAGRSPPRKE